ncbi:hypothetical protein E2C01_011111 [Portunus trituberculatus]|uniref:Uncharacterized protein n=1 Tax=Portunus trituberculatus TaxID=210409 RepID=A0A5B7DAI4_PORTR|nr:hypothetical protein [Portunus trituberculatus]
MPPESIPASCNEVNLPHRPSGSVEVVSKQDPVLLSTLAFPPRPSSIVPLVLCEEDSLPFPSPQVATSQSVKRLRPQESYEKCNSVTLVRQSSKDQVSFVEADVQQQVQSRGLLERGTRGSGWVYRLQQSEQTHVQSWWRVW